MQRQEIRLGLWENIGQFSLLVLITAFVGSMVGLERTVDVNRKVAIIKQSSMPPSKDAYLDGYNLNAFYAIVRYLSKK